MQSDFEKNDGIKKLVYTAVLTALAAVLTMFPQIPTGAGGYVHFGDSVIYAAAVFLGPVGGAVVGGIGHSLADFLSGYAIFVLPTLIIKGAVGYVFGAAAKGNIKGKRLYAAFGLALVIITAGYFIAEIPLLGLPAAMTSLVSSPVQWLMSVAVSAILIPVVNRILRSR